MTKTIFCECGCGNKPKKGNRFINGHNSSLRIGKKHPMFGKHHSEETKEKQRQASSGENNAMFGLIEKDSPNYGRKYSKKTCRKISKSLSGENNPMCGLHGEDNPNYIDEYSSERNSSKKRGLGFFPLNEKTKIANEQHHIDKKLVVFIPRKLHRKIRHSVKTGRKINEMNRLAFKWCEDQGIELQRSLQSFGNKGVLIWDY